MAGILLPACGPSWHHPSLPLPQQDVRAQAAEECNHVAKDEAEREGTYSTSQSGTSLGVTSRGSIGVSHTIDLTAIFWDWLSDHRLKANAFERCMRGRGWVKDEKE
jgi:hypothetical protein